MSIAEIKYAFTQIRMLFAKKLYEVHAFWETIPSQLQKIIIIVTIVAIVNIIVSLIKAIIINKETWKKRLDSELMFSFAAGSGQYQRTYIFKDARKYAFDKKWSLFSFAGIAYRLGNYKHESKVILLLCAITYLPLMILGIAEMILRCVIGFTAFLVINISYSLFLLCLGILNLILIPVFNTADRLSWVTQHCPKCYKSFKFPVFECPHCGTKHEKLYPGKVVSCLQSVPVAVLYLVHLL